MYCHLLRLILCKLARSSRGFDLLTALLSSSRDEIFDCQEDRHLIIVHLCADGASFRDGTSRHAKKRNKRRKNLMRDLIINKTFFMGCIAAAVCGDDGLMEETWKHIPLPLPPAAWQPACSCHAAVLWIFYTHTLVHTHTSRLPNETHVSDARKKKKSFCSSFSITTRNVRTCCICCANTNTVAVET